MESAVVPIRMRGNTKCLKFAKMLKNMFGVGFRREALWSKDIFFSVEEMHDRYRVRLGRVENRGNFVKVFDFNGVPSFVVPASCLSDVDSIGVSVSGIGDSVFISPGGCDGYFMNGSKRYVILYRGFPHGEYCFSNIIKDGSWCISLDRRVKDNEIPASTLGGSVTFSLENFDRLYYCYNENGSLKGVKCEIDYEGGYLDLLRVSNDSQY